METKKVKMSPGNRLETGSAVLAAAQVVDIRAVKPRLAAFAKVHRNYLEAHRKAEMAEVQLTAAAARLAELDAVQDEGVEELARSLVTDGRSRRNPFAGFGSATASDIKKLPFAEEAKAIRKLAAAVRADKTPSQATLRAARAAEQTAQAVEAALIPLDKLQAAARTARETREHIGRTWQTALSALKRSARAADDNGGPALSTALFGGLRRARSKTVAPPAAPTPVASPAAQPADPPAPAA